jgi:flagellar hook assembly protein FlgD
VDTGDKFILDNLLNYPNPFSNATKISAGHNRPDENLVVRISIYSLNGQVIRIINATLISSGYQLPPVEWDGSDSGGKRAGKGVYPYTVTIRTSSGETASISGRMIIL